MKLFSLNLAPGGDEVPVCYRIPNAVGLPDGRVMAFAQERREIVHDAVVENEDGTQELVPTIYHACHDASGVNFVYRIREADGVTWGEARPVLQGLPEYSGLRRVGVVTSYSVAYDRVRDRVVMLFVGRYDSTRNRLSADTDTGYLYTVFSPSSGTWSVPQRIASSDLRAGGGHFKPGKGRSVGPGHGVQLKEDGRLVFCGYLALARGGDGREIEGPSAYVSTVIWATPEGGGYSWHSTQDSDNFGAGMGNNYELDTNECSIMELGNGDLRMTARTSDPGRRWNSTWRWKPSGGHPELTLVEGRAVGGWTAISVHHSNLSYGSILYSSWPGGPGLDGLYIEREDERTGTTRRYRAIDEIVRYTDLVFDRAKRSDGVGILYESASEEMWHEHDKHLVTGIWYVHSRPSWGRSLLLLQ